jgi:hypothetical protein
MEDDIDPNSSAFQPDPHSPQTDPAAEAANQAEIARQRAAANKPVPVPTDFDPRTQLKAGPATGKPEAAAPSSDSEYHPAQDIRTSTAGGKGFPTDTPTSKRWLLEDNPNLSWADTIGRGFQRSVAETEVGLGQLADLALGPDQYRRSFRRPKGSPPGEGNILVTQKAGSRDVPRGLGWLDEFARNRRPGTWLHEVGTGPSAGPAEATARVGGDILQLAATGGGAGLPMLARLAGWGVTRPADSLLERGINTAVSVGGGKIGSWAASKALAAAEATIGQISKSMGAIASEISAKFPIDKRVANSTLKGVLNRTRMTVRAGAPADMLDGVEERITKVMKGGGTFGADVAGKLMEDISLAEQEARSKGYSAVANGMSRMREEFQKTVVSHSGGTAKGAFDKANAELEKAMAPAGKPVWEAPWWRHAGWGLGHYANPAALANLAARGVGAVAKPVWRGVNKTRLAAPLAAEGATRAAEAEEDTK